METLIIILLLFIGIVLGVFSVIFYQDCKESDRKIKETNESIKQLNERIENEKRKFYKDFPIGL